MWSSNARRKNQYLHRVLGMDTNPVVTNRSVNLARNTPNTHSLDLYPPLQIPASLQPGSFGLNPDQTKAPLAYGRWGIPQLLRHINTHDRVVRLRSLRTLLDELYDPTKLNHALRIFIAKRLNDSLDKIINVLVDCDLDTRPIEVESVFLCLVVLARNLDGAIAILKEDKLMDKIFDMISFTHPRIPGVSIEILSVMASHQKIAEDMNARDYLVRIKEYLPQLETINYFYEFIGSLFERNPKLGMEHGYFDILLPKITVQDAIQINVMKAFALLLACGEAHYVCDRKVIIQILYNLMKNDELSDDVMEYVVMALQNITVTTRSRWKCRELWDITVMLIEMAHRKISAELQLVCLQALRQITEMPSVKKYTRKVGGSHLEKVRCKFPENRIKRNNLVKWLHQHPYPENL